MRFRVLQTNWERVQILWAGPWGEVSAPLSLVLIWDGRVAGPNLMKYVWERSAKN